MKQDKAKQSKEPSNGGWGYACVFGMVICMMLFGLSARTFGLLYVILLTEFQTTATIASLLGAINILAWGVFGPAASLICTKYGCRCATAIGTACQSLGFILTGFAPNVFTVFLTFGLLVGIGTSLCTTSSFLIVSQYFHKRRAIATSFGSSGASFSVIALPATMKYILNEYDFAGTMIILGGICLHGFIAAALYRPLLTTEETQKSTDAIQECQKQNSSNVLHGYGRPKDNVLSNERSTDQYSEQTSFLLESKEAETIQNTNRHSQTKRSPCCIQLTCVSVIKHNPIVMCLMLVNLTSAMQQGVVTSFTPSLAIDNGVSQYLAFLLITWSGIVDAVGKCVTGFIMDLRAVKSHILIAYGLVAVISGACCFVFPLYSQFFYYVIVYGIGTFFTGAIFVQRSTVLLSVLSSKEMPIIFGVLQCCNSIGLTAGRALGGIIRDVTGAYNYAYFIVSGISVLSSLILIFCSACMKKKRDPVETELSVVTT